MKRPEWKPFPSRDSPIMDFINYKPTSYVNSIGRKLRIREKLKELEPLERKKIIEECKKRTDIAPI